MSQPLLTCGWLYSQFAIIHYIPELRLLALVVLDPLRAEISLVRSMRGSCVDPIPYAMH